MMKPLSPSDIMLIVSAVTLVAALIWFVLLYLRTARNLFESRKDEWRLFEFLLHFGHFSSDPEDPDQERLRDEAHRRARRPRDTPPAFF